MKQRSKVIKRTLLQQCQTIAGDCPTTAIRKDASRSQDVDKFLAQLKIDRGRGSGHTHAAYSTATCQYPVDIREGGCFGLSDGLSFDTVEFVAIRESIRRS